jgi:hypothetical protein
MPEGQHLLDHRDDAGDPGFDQGADQGVQQREHRMQDHGIGPRGFAALGGGPDGAAVRRCGVM